MTQWFDIEISPDVVFSDLLDGGVLFDLNSKQYFALNTSGSIVWKVLESGGRLDSLEGRLRTIYPTQDTRDPFGLQAFAEALRRAALATTADIGTNGEVMQAESLPTEWTLPSIERHGNPLAEVILSPFDPTVPIPE